MARYFQNRVLGYSLVNIIILIKATFVASDNVRKTPYLRQVLYILKGRVVSSGVGSGCVRKITTSQS